MTRAASMGRLGSTHGDFWMNLQGECLRHAIDRKQRVIAGLLKALGLTGRPTSGAAAKGERRGGKRLAVARVAARWVFCEALGISSPPTETKNKPNFEDSEVK